MVTRDSDRVVTPEPTAQLLRRTSHRTRVKRTCLHARHAVRATTLSSTAAPFRHTREMAEVDRMVRRSTAQHGADLCKCLRVDHYCMSMHDALRNAEPLTTADDQKTVVPNDRRWPAQRAAVELPRGSSHVPRMRHYAPSA